MKYAIAHLENLKALGTYLFFIFIDNFLIFACLPPKKREADILSKAFSGRFGFDVLELRKSQTVSQKQSNENAPLGDYILRYILIWRGVFSVARFD
jgi:hypothetical protein